MRSTTHESHVSCEQRAAALLLLDSRGKDLKKKPKPGLCPCQGHLWSQQSPELRHRFKLCFGRCSKLAQVSQRPFAVPVLRPHRSVLMFACLSHTGGFSSRVKVLQASEVATPMRPPVPYYGTYSQ